MFAWDPSTYSILKPDYHVTITPSITPSFTVREAIEVYSRLKLQIMSRYTMNSHWNVEIVKRSIWAEPSGYRIF